MKQQKSLTENEHFGGLIESKHFAFDHLIITCFTRNETADREVLIAVRRHIILAQP